MATNDARELVSKALSGSRSGERKKLSLPSECCVLSK